MLQARQTAVQQVGVTVFQTFSETQTEVPVRCRSSQIISDATVALLIVRVTAWEQISVWYITPTSMTITTGTRTAATTTSTASTSTTAAPAFSTTAGTMTTTTTTTTSTSATTTTTTSATTTKYY